jgi:redox-regulated HSP33 family molecular chaperone
MDKLIHGTAADGTVRVMAAITTDITSRSGSPPRKLRRRFPPRSGRVFNRNALLGASLKEFDRLTVKIESTAR